MLAGKLPPDLLTRILSKVVVKDPRVVLGPKPGEDAALIDFGDRYLVAKTDPVTFATDLIGWYMVQINANDLATMGATPRWLMATVLLPEGSSPEQIELIMDQILEACSMLRVTLIGGHTEISYDLPRPIAVGSMLGEVDKDKAILTSGAHLGDSIVLTKGIAIEGTALLAREASEALNVAGVSPDVIEKAKRLLFAPGIGITREAFIIRETVQVHAMHDPTEGGLVTGLREMSEAANLGVMADLDLIPLLPESEIICQALELDPLGLIASGSLLAAVAPEDVTHLIGTLADANIAAYEIGHFTDYEKGLKLRTSKGICDMPSFERDELARYFSP